jgi:hypothetical protein
MKEAHLRGKVSDRIRQILDLATDPAKDTIKQSRFDFVRLSRFSSCVSSIDHIYRSVCFATDF